MNRRKFLALAASTVAALPLKAAPPMTMQDAMRRVRELWGSCGVTRVHPGYSSRPNGEFMIGWMDKSGRAQFWYGDSWADAFATYRSMPTPIDPATGKPIIKDPPGPNS